jgi:hypothetical protein
MMLFGETTKSLLRVALTVFSPLLLLQFGCGGGNLLPHAATPPTPASLKSLSVTPNQAVVALGDNQQFSATGLFSDGTQRDLTKTVVWSTAQPAVASVNAQGLARSLSQGSASIVATSGGVDGSATLTVSKAALVALTLQPSNLSLKAGSSQQLSALGSFSDGSHQDLTSSVTWSCTPGSVASISPSGMVTALALGKATITAVSGSIQAFDSLSVAVLASILVAPAGISIPLGETQQLSAEGTFTDGSTVDLTPSVVWNSTQPAIVLVSSSGLASARGVGSTQVTATSGSVVGQSQLTVGPAVVLSINVTPPSASVMLGGTQQFQIVGTFSDGTTQALSTAASWSSSDPAVAGIDANGLASGQQVGSTTIQASSNSLSGSAILTVQPGIAVTYFDGANTPTVSADGTVRITNPGFTGGTLCAMVYVFDPDQEMSECCGCAVSHDALRTLSINHDLTGNPLTGIKPTDGVLKVIAADQASNPSCDPTSITPSGILTTWATHLQTFGGSAFVATEDNIQPSVLGADELSNLQSQCSFVVSLGSSQGVCTCGVGD